MKIKTILDSALGSTPYISQAYGGIGVAKTCVLAMLSLTQA